MLRPIVEVLEAYGLFALRIDEIGSGIINQTWKLELDDERTLVLQKVNPMFPASVNDDYKPVDGASQEKGIANTGTHSELERWLYHRVRR